MTQAALLSAEGIVKNFGGVRALHAVSLAVAPGAVFAIIGPNGAGKSTLLNVLSGIHQPDAGRMALGGVDLVGLPPHRRARLGLARTFQKIRLFKHLTAIENVLAGFHIRHRIPAWEYVFPGTGFRRDRVRCREEAMGLLAFVGLDAQADLPARALAYGQQRMLEIARALAAQPRLLMVDEPAAGLNPAEVDRLLERLRELRGRGLTVVIVEHNMDLVMTLADRILVINYGERLFEGTPAEVQAHPEVIAAYLGEEPL